MHKPQINAAHFKTTSTPDEAAFDKWADTAVESTLTLGKPLTTDEATARLAFYVALLSAATCADCCSGAVCQKHSSMEAVDRMVPAARQMLASAYAPS